MCRLHSYHEWRDWLANRYEKWHLHLENKLTSETDGGTDYGAAKAGTSNAAAYHKSGVCGMLDWGVDVFYFEAFDEPWKPASVGDNGAAEDETHWGAYTSDRTAKFNLSC